MNVKMMFAGCTAKLREKPSSFVHLQNQILGSLTSQSWLGSWLPGAEQWISNCGASTEYRDSSYPPRGGGSQEKMLPSCISPAEQFAKSNSGYKTNLQIKYSRGQVTGFVLQYIIWRLKMASFPSGGTKNVRRQANPGREGIQFAEKQPPHPTQGRAHLS